MFCFDSNSSVSHLNAGLTVISVGVFCTKRLGPDMRQGGKTILLRTKSFLLGFLPFFIVEAGLRETAVV